MLLGRASYVTRERQVNEHRELQRMDRAVMTARDILLDHLPYKINVGAPATRCHCGAIFEIVTRWADHVAILLADDVVPTARWSDPSESHAAARSVRSTSAAHRRIMLLFTYTHQMSDAQIAAEYQRRVASEDWPTISASGLRTRRRELVTAGLLRDSKRRAMTPSGRQTAVWEVNE